MAAAVAPSSITASVSMGAGRGTNAPIRNQAPRAIAAAGHHSSTTSSGPVPRFPVVLASSPPADDDPGERPRDVPQPAERVDAAKHPGDEANDTDEHDEHRPGLVPAEAEDLLDEQDDAESHEPRRRDQRPTSGRSHGFGAA
jgi:hypothetical protein